MKKEKMTLLIVIMILLLGISPLAARENKMAVGIQAGFSATGVVFDIGLGPVYLNAGLNYPLGTPISHPLQMLPPPKHFPQ